MAMAKSILVQGKRFTSKKTKPGLSFLKVGQIYPVDESVSTR